MRLEKWQGAGNAYLIVWQDQLPGPLGAADARRLCDPRLGLGGDGVLVLSPSEVADVRMRIVNPDGSESEACGNGTRMVARLIGGDEPAAVTIETVVGILPCRVHADGSVSARLADARLDGPAYAPERGTLPDPHRFVSIGNPHLAMRVEDPATFPLAHEGPVLECHPCLPQRANVEVWRATPDGVEMRVWERGVGETDACGSGACAVAVAAVLDGAATTPVRVELAGGTLVVAVGDDLSVELTGPAERIATIEIAPALAEAFR